MIKKDMLRIINEEIVNFDFLNNEQYLKEEENIRILQNPKFQKQFIIDSITKMRDKIKINDVVAEYVTNDLNDLRGYHNDLNIDIQIELTYQSDLNNKLIDFSLGFLGNNISYTTDYSTSRGDYWTPTYTDLWYNGIDWNSINVNLYSNEGDEIKFVAFDNAPLNIQELFIRAYIEDIIINKTEIKTKEEKPQFTSF